MSWRQDRLDVAKRAVTKGVMSHPGYYLARSFYWTRRPDMEMDGSAWGWFRPSFLIGSKQFNQIAAGDA
jgi:hypothetical protein